MIGPADAIPLSQDLETFRHPVLGRVFEIGTLLTPVSSFLFVLAEVVPGLLQGSLLILKHLIDFGDALFLLPLPLEAWLARSEVAHSQVHQASHVREQD